MYVLTGVVGDSVGTQHLWNIGQAISSDLPGKQTSVMRVVSFPAFEAQDSISESRSLSHGLVHERHVVHFKRTNSGGTN
jgi:hypothetical protein